MNIWNIYFFEWVSLYPSGKYSEVEPPNEMDFWLLIFLYILVLCLVMVGFYEKGVLVPHTPPASAFLHHSSIPILYSHALAPMVSFLLIPILLPIVTMIISVSINRFSYLLPLQHLIFVFWIIAILIGVKRYITLVLVFVSLI